MMSAVRPPRLPLLRLREEGADVQVVGVEANKVYASKHGYEVTTDLAAGDAYRMEFDAVVVPGGGAPDKMRMVPEMNAIVKTNFDKGNVVAAICHGPQVLISAGVLKGMRATCYAAIKDDVLNAGATYTDEEVVRHDNLITSRVPSDLPAFMREVIAALQ